MPMTTSDLAAIAGARREASRLSDHDLKRRRDAAAFVLVEAEWFGDEPFAEFCREMLGLYRAECTHRGLPDDEIRVLVIVETW